MVVEQKSPYGDSGEVLRRYTAWNDPSENRNKSLSEVVKILKMRLENKTLDDDKISKLLHMLPKDSNWQEVNKVIDDVLISRERDLKRSRDYYTKDQLKHQRKLFSNILQKRAGKLNQGEVLADKYMVGEEDFWDSNDESEESDKDNAEKIEKHFDKVVEVEHKRSLDLGLIRGDRNLGKSDMNPVVKTTGISELAMDSSKRNQHVGEYYKSEKLKRKISSERGARAARKDERRYF